MPSTTALLRRADGRLIPITNAWPEAHSETPGLRNVVVSAGGVTVRRDGLSVDEADVLLVQILAGGVFDEELNPVSNNRH